MTLEGQEPHWALTEEHQLPQNDESNNNNNNNDYNVDNSNHNDNNDDNDDENDDDDNENNDDNDEEYTPLSDLENEKMNHDTDKLKSFGNEAPVLTGRLRALIPIGRLWAMLGHIGITTALEFRIKRVRVQGRKSSGSSWRSSMGPLWSIGTWDQLSEHLAAMM
jgi:hypothetical protein